MSKKYCAIIQNIKKEELLCYVSQINYKFRVCDCNIKSKMRKNVFFSLITLMNFSRLTDDVVKLSHSKLPILVVFQ